MSLTVQAAVVRRIIDIAGAQGASREALWGATGVTSAIDDGERVPAERLYDLWSAAARQASPHLTVAVTREITMEQLGLFGFAVLTAPDCATALQSVARLFPIITDSGRWLPHLQARSLVVQWERAPSRSVGQHLSTEATLGHFVFCARQTFGNAAPRLTRVSLRHSVTPERRAVLREHFDCALEVNAPCDALEWERELTDVVPRLANPAMHAHFVAAAQPLLARVALPPSCAEAVRAQLLRRMADGQPAMNEVARALGLSVRTLRRRLEQERRSYQGLMDEVRRELATDLLAQPSASITRVAFDIGFSDSTAFARAHRRWYGTAPKTARRASVKAR